jgi:choline dehydrogenase-like flavoprotein
MQIIAPRHTFDVIVVGSGASGGWAAKRLAEAGVKVALVDAGRPLTDAAYSEHMRPFELKYRDRGARADPPDETRAEGVLRLHGIQLRLVRERSGRTLYDPGKANPSAGWDGCA